MYQGQTEWWDKEPQIETGGQKLFIENLFGIIMVFRKDPCGFFCILMTYGNGAS